MSNKLDFDFIALPQRVTNTMLFSENNIKKVMLFSFDIITAKSSEKIYSAETIEDNLKITAPSIRRYRNSENYLRGMADFILSLDSLSQKQIIQSLPHKSKLKDLIYAKKVLKGQSPTENQSADFYAPKQSEQNINNIRTLNKQHINNTRTKDEQKTEVKNIKTSTIDKGQTELLEKDENEQHLNGNLTAEELDKNEKITENRHNKRGEEELEKDFIKKLKQKSY